MELTSTNHAKVYGLYPDKGSIGLGFDADIVLWDPNWKETISQLLLHHGSDYTPHEGLQVTGWPVMTRCAARLWRKRAKSPGKRAMAGFSGVVSRLMRGRLDTASMDGRVYA